jgi:uncharacterized damage-inducible protein DinB
MNGLQGVQQITQQMIQILQKIDQGAYQQAIDIFDGSTVGKHFRHILDFYFCLIKGFNQGKIDYSDRSRNPRIEVEPQTAADHFSNALNQLHELTLDMPIIVMSDFSTSNEVERVSYTSTIGREMAFIHDHAVHHLAIIKMGIKRINPNFKLGAHFGVAPSTIKFVQGQLPNG